MHNKCRYAKDIYTIYYILAYIHIYIYIYIYIYILLTYIEGITAPWYIIFHIRELFENVFPILSPY